MLESFSELCYYPPSLSTLTFEGGDITGDYCTEVAAHPPEDCLKGKPLTELTDAEMKVIYQAVPMNVSEAEPKDVPARKLIHLFNVISMPALP